jgi:hypothetical protein
MSVKPIVLLLNSQGKLERRFITKCDLCGKSLLHKNGDFKWSEVEMLDDAIRPLYFCSKECKRGMEAKIASNNGFFPNEKLSIRSV